MNKLNLGEFNDSSFFLKQLQEVIGEKPELQPISKPVYRGESKVDGVTLKEYRYQNGLGEFVGMTLAEPNIRKWPNPIIAIHQTNECGRKEIFGQDENQFLDYGLSLAKRGHRVFAIDLFLTGERNPTNSWNSHPFYEKYPRWSVVGKDILDLTDLSYVINNYFNETNKINCIGHSQGGLVGIFFAAIENNRVSRLVANAAYFGKHMNDDFDPWQHALYKTGFLNNQNRQACIAQNMDLVVSMASRGGDTLLVVYSRDKIMEKPVPSNDELERMKFYSNNVSLVKFDLGHVFPKIVQDACFQFMEIGAPDRKDTPISNLPKSLVVEDAIIQMEREHLVVIEILEAKERQRDAAEQRQRDAERQRDAAEQRQRDAEQQRDAAEQRQRDAERQRDAAEQQYEVLLGEYQAVVEQLKKRIGVRRGWLEILRSIKRRLLGILGISSRIWRRLFYLPEAVVTTENFPFPWEPITTPLPSVDGQLRVLVLSHMFPHPNQPGSGSFVFEQVKALREYTHIDVRVLAGQPDWILSRNPIHVWLGLMAHNKKFISSGWWNLFGVPTKYIPYRILAPFWSHGWMYRLAMMRAIKSLRVEFPFDLIHAHTGYLDGSAGQAIARRFGVPLLITEHTGPFSVLTSNPIVKHDTLRSLNNATRVIAVSAAQKRNVAVHMSPKSHENIRIIPNGVDTNVFYPAEQWKPNPLAPRIFFVGYFAPVKNIPLLIEAFALVQSELHEAQLTLVGGGEAQQVSEIKKLINQMELNQAVAIIGYESRDEIARMMREECDMLVLSSDAETFGVVLIEALASGRPVVATRCGGPEDIVNDPALGELCSPGDAQALAAAILKVARRLPQYNPDQIRENAVKRFAYERIAEAVSREYVDILHLVAKKK